MKTHILLAICTFFLFCQCNDVEIKSPIGPGLGPIHENYVNSYIKLDKVDFIVDSDTSTLWKRKSFGLQYGSGAIYSMDKSQPDANKAEFQRLAKLYNDTAFNDHVDFCFRADPCLTDTIRTIDITCTNKAYNQAHPANSQLNDIINIGYASAKEYIDNHYPSKGDSINSGYRCISLKQFNSHPNVLVGMDNITFRFSRQPDETADFIFAITMVLQSGKTYYHVYNPIRLRKN
jgi:hypothetical protein